MPKQHLSDIDLNSQARILNLPDPTLAQHAATKAYVDSAVEGLAWKDSCRVSTQANLTIASPGATIDGITMAANDRVLVRAQTTQTENGIYIWNGAATPLTRAPDASTFPELEQAVVTVEEGTSAGSTFRQTAVNGVLGTNNVLWSTFGTAAAPASETVAGILELATQAETDTGTDDARAVTPAKLAGWSGRTRRFGPTTIGDGSATQFTITHNLNTRELDVVVRRTSGAFDEVECDKEFTTVNTVTLRFAAPPAAGAFSAYVVG